MGHKYALEDGLYGGQGFIADGILDLALGEIKENNDLSMRGHAHLRFGIAGLSGSGSTTSAAISDGIG